MKSLRAWATPLTVGTFLVISVTGVLMFFHADSGLNKVIHEWIGLAMVAAVGAHLLLNWRAFTTYFKRPLAVTVMGVGAAVLAASFLLGGATEGGPDGMRALMMSVGNARIETLADLAGKDTETVLTSLDAAGYTAEASETLATLSGGDRTAQDQIISVVFAR